MAKKRRKPRARSPQPAAGVGQGAGRSTETKAPPTHARAERKELARAAREDARRRLERRMRVRRGVAILGVAAVVGVAGYLILRTDAAGSIPEETLALARAAGCGDVVAPLGSAPGGQHLGSGEDTTYDQQPASSGFHDPAPIREENVVHNLEHGYVVLYYRAEDPDPLPEDIVASLARIAESQDKVFLAPYPDLPEGTSLEMVAWNKTWGCPSTVSAADASAMATAFIEAFRGTTNAPEGNVP
jgi:hypothetical protein